MGFLRQRQQGRSDKFCDAARRVGAMAKNIPGSGVRQAMDVLAGLLKMAVLGRPVSGFERVGIYNPIPNV
jgi:hypothetical protein